MDDLDLALAMESASDADIDREIAARGLRGYSEAAWSLVEPGRDFVGGWHIDAICEHLEAVASGEINRLVINVPPGSMKSLSCSVFFPTWLWSRSPEQKFIYASYSEDIARRDSLRCRRLIESTWYKERWGHVVRPIKNSWSTSKFANEAGGLRMITTPSGSVTGEHADIQVVDDPIKPIEAKSSMVSTVALEKCITWWDETMSSRMVDQGKSARIIIMQRLHQSDLAGHVLKSGGYEHLCLPMEFEPDRKCFTSLGWEDPRTEPDELLWPERVDAAAVKALKRDLGPAAAPQLQQSPSPASGSIFKRSQMQHYKVAPRCRKVIQSWDCTFKATGSSYVVGQVWGTHDGGFYLLDQVRARMSFSQTCSAIKAMSAKWPRAYGKVIEDKANGSAVADELKKEMNGIILVNPMGGKEARANSVEPYWEAMDVWLPEAYAAPWVNDFIEEHLVFPVGSNDDQVDAQTQALTYLRTRNTDRLRKAMQNARK